MSQEASFTLCPRTSADRQCHVLSGTILESWRPPTQRPSHHRSLRASPFEPLVHNRRGLPKGGTITPLRINEYTTSGSSPPITEIRIPTPPINPADDVSCESTLPETAEEWRDLYWLAQEDVARVQADHQRVVDENRRLKRQLIELQKQLYVQQRRCAEAPWEVPTRHVRPRRLPHIVSTEEKSATREEEDVE